MGIIVLLLVSCAAIDKEKAELNYCSTLPFVIPVLCPQTHMAFLCLLLKLLG